MMSGTKRAPMIRRAVLLGPVAALMLAACEPKVALRGNDPLESKLESVQVDRSTKRDVMQLLGTPSVVGLFEDDTWYYLSQRKEQWAFYAPEVTEHKAMAFHFDEQGVLRKVNTMDQEALAEVAYREQETPTSGRTLSIFEQLFGNLGSGLGR